MKTRFSFVVKALAVTLALALAFGLGPVGMKVAKAAGITVAITATGNPFSSGVDIVLSAATTGETGTVTYEWFVGAPSGTALADTNSVTGDSDNLVSGTPDDTLTIDGATLESISLDGLTIYVVATDDISAESASIVLKAGYTITVTNGTASPTGLVAAGTLVTITATPQGGKRFTSWTVPASITDLSSTTVSPATFTMPAEDVEITAVFEAIPAQSGPPIVIWDGYYGYSSAVTALQSNLKLTTAVPGSVGGTVVLTYPGTLPSGATIQWQILVNGTWVDIADATSTPYTAGGFEPGTVNNFRAVVKYGGSTYTSGDMIAAAGQEATMEIVPPVEVTPETSKYVVKVRALNLRSGPGTTYSKVETLSRNDTVNVIKVENGWAMFMFNGKEIWCSLGNGKYLAPQ